ncbi:sugar ABC transporter permease [Jannaschia sp. LMIT008]|uniref:carbohydrate ABC transporter permease n=1 Tax=Jannaschia maritima TaxID=3032585 RepID=UPI0028110D5F|nr:sugar ABC transporter permease [Jannaschia sp. LMIT008]
MATAPEIRHRRRLGAALALPAALTLLVLVIGPSLAVLGLSVTDYRLGMPGANWVGAANYAALATDAGLRGSLANTFAFVAVVAPLAVFGGLWVAILVAGAGRARGLAQTVFFLPVTATLVAMATAWEVLLHPSFGMANALLGVLGLPAQRFLSDPNLALWTLAVLAVWKLLGYNVLLFLAGLATIDRTLYEAAALDGAEAGWRRFTLVTWPMLAPVTLFVTVITLIRTFGEFELVVVLTNGGPDGATEMVLFTLYQEAFRYFDIGRASALAAVFLVFVMALSLTQIWIAERRR